MRHTWVIYILMAFLSGASQWTSVGFSIESQPTSYWIGLMLGSSLVIVILYAIMSLSIDYLGRWIFRFEGRFMDFMIVQAWSLVPVLITVLLQLIITVLMKFGKPAGINGGVDLALVATVLVGFLQAVGIIWAVVIAVVGIKLVQKTTTAKSIGNYAVAGLSIMLLFFVISMAAAYYQKQQNMSENNRPTGIEEIISTNE